MKDDNKKNNYSSVPDDKIDETETFSSLIKNNYNQKIKPSNKSNKREIVNPLDVNKTGFSENNNEKYKPPKQSLHKPKTIINHQSIKQSTKLEVTDRNFVDTKFDSISEENSTNTPSQVNYSIHSRLAKKLSQGKIDIDQTLDLHSYYQKQAQELLIDFLFSCHKQNLRNLLVITGKGQGKLRSMALQLFLTKKAQTIIAGYFQAPAKLGGDGAYIVRLRRKKNNN